MILFATLSTMKPETLNLKLIVTFACIVFLVTGSNAHAAQTGDSEVDQAAIEAKEAVSQEKTWEQLTPSAAHFDWILVDKIRRQKAMSWWSIDARVMALSRDFFRYLVLPRSLADDQFIFYD